MIHVNTFCLFVFNEFNDESTFVFNGYADKSIDILFETSFNNGDVNKIVSCIFYCKSFNDASTFIFNG